jgi:adenylate kinase
MEKSNRKVYCFLGLPASGKGTQVKILSQKIGAQSVGMGDLIRDEIKNADLSDPFYKKMKEDYDKGTPQSDSIALDLVEKFIKSSEGTVILDNFPFSIKQTRMFFGICKRIGVKDPLLIVVDVSREEALNRALKRKICVNCGSVYIGGESNICEKCGGALITRTDDNEATVSARLDKYFPRIEEVKNEFSKHGNIVIVNGEQSIENVALEIENKLMSVNDFNQKKSN